MTIDSESQFSFILPYSLVDEFGIEEKASGDLLRYKMKLHGENM
jgi:hypothetical protein